MKMHARIEARPEFQLTLPVGTVEVLMKLSAAHYDSTCREAGRQGGFLYGWRNAEKFAAENGMAEVVLYQVLFRQLDLVAKICEGIATAGLSEEEKDRAGLFFLLAARAMRESNRVSYYEKKWDAYEVEVGKL